jgi:hypothetical protein
MKEQIDIPKALLQGALLAFETRLVDQRRIGVQVFGQVLPLYQITGVAAAVASLFGDIAHSFILPHISKNKRMESAESAVLNIALNAVVYQGLLYVLNPNAIQAIGMKRIWAESAISVAGADYVARNFIDLKI